MDNNEAMTIEYEGRSYLVGISNSGKVRFVAVENPTGRAVGGKLRCKLSSVIMTEFWASFGFDRSPTPTPAAAADARVPSHITPRYVAARVRKILAAQGWPLHKMTGRYSPFRNTQSGTEGYSVRRIGVGKFCAVGYSPAYADGRTVDLPRGVVRAKELAAWELLRGLGYRVSDVGWIECDYHD